MPVEHENLGLESSVLRKGLTFIEGQEFLYEFRQPEVRCKIIEMREKLRAGWWDNTDVLDHNAEGKAEPVRVSIFLLSSTERELHRVEFARYRLRELQRQEGIQVQN